MNDVGDNPDDSRPASSAADAQATLPRRSSREKRRRSNQKMVDNVEKEEIVRMYAETDQNLQKCAEAHNLTAINVKSVLNNVIKKHRALARVLGTEVQNELSEGVRNTRSMTKAVQDPANQSMDITSDVRIKDRTFADYPLFDEDDDFDDDYNYKSESGDEEDVSGSSTSSDEDEEDYSEIDLSELDEIGQLDVTMVDKGERDSSGVDGTRERDWSGVDGTRAPSRARPDSVASLTLNKMVGDDYESSNDYDSFLNGLRNASMEYDEEDEELDPDFTLRLDDITRSYADDLEMADFSHNIPHREVEQLVQDIVPPERMEELAHHLTPPLPPSPLREYAELTPVAAAVMDEEEDVRREVRPSSILNDFLRSQIRAQLEQHLQLLTQTFVGCYFEPLLQGVKEEAGKMIESFASLSSLATHLGSASAFYSANLDFSMETCNSMRSLPPPSSITPLKKEQLVYPQPMLAITKRVLSSSAAILYPSLVSQHRLAQSIGSEGWNWNELIYFALALNRYSDLPEKSKLPSQGRYSVIAANQMPWRSLIDLRWQFNAMKRGLKRNGRVSQNKQFFGVLEGTMEVFREAPPRAEVGWTMKDWPRATTPQWFKNFQADEHRRRAEEKRKQGGAARRKREGMIEEGDEEMEAIVIVEGDDKEEREDRPDSDIDVVTVHYGDEAAERKDRQRKSERGVMTRRSMRAMLSRPTSKCSSEKSVDRVETARGASDGEEESGRRRGGDTSAPIDFSQLMDEMSLPSSSRVVTPPPSRKYGARSATPNDKTILPRTPGRRRPSPMEESMDWLEMAPMDALCSPPRSPRSPTLSRIKTPGGTMEYVDSLMGYFGTPEREMEIESENEKAAGPSKNKTAYVNLFGDFDFDEITNQDEDAIAQRAFVDVSGEEGGEESSGLRREEAEGEKEEEDQSIRGASEQVKQRKKRQTREERERAGLEAMSNPAVRRRVMACLARKTEEDVRSRMNMHSSILKQIQAVLSTRINLKHREEMVANLVKVLSPSHKEVLYLLAVFVPRSSLPRPLLLSPSRHAYAVAFEIITIIFAYMSKMQRKLSYRQLLRMIMEAYSQRGREGISETLKDALVNDPVLLKALHKFILPPIDAKDRGKWEMIDLRKGDEAFRIFKADSLLERADLCEVLGPLPTKREMAARGMLPATLTHSFDGEPCLRNKEGKYSEIAVRSEKEVEEERKAREIEREVEKKSKKREKTIERVKAAKKAKLVERREERAREKKAAVEEKRMEEEERKKEDRPPPPVDLPTLPFTREMDKALLLLYNDVETVTKRSIRKLAIDHPYSTNFTQAQLQARLEKLVEFMQK